MLINKLLLSALALTSFSAFGSIAGNWQGPCEVRGAKSVKFTYLFSEVDADGNGSLAKTKIYYDDAACSVYNHTGRATVTYKLADSAVEGILNLDVNHRGTLFYDIVSKSEDGKVLSFGDTDSRDPATRPTQLSTTDRVFTLIEE